MSWRWPSQNTFGMWTVLYWTRSSRTHFGVSINVWRLAGDTLNITCNFLYCNHQVHRDFWSPFICTTSLAFTNSTFCPHSAFMSCADLRTKSDYFPIRHSLTGFYNQDGVFTARYGLNIYKTQVYFSTYSFMLRATYKPATFVTHMSLLKWPFTYFAKNLIRQMTQSA
jgi:hypothetical protein